VKASKSLCETAFAGELEAQARGCLIATDAVDIVVVNWTCAHAVHTVSPISQDALTSIHATALAVALIAHWPRPEPS
jgi:hypothetical protein